MAWFDDKQPKNDLARAVLLLVEEMQRNAIARALEMEWFRSHLNSPTRYDLERMEGRIMEAIQSFASRVNARFDTLETEIGDIAKDVDGLDEALKQAIANANLSPEDKAALDGIEERLAGIGERAAAVNAKVGPRPEPQPV